MIDLTLRTLVDKDLDNVVNYANNINIAKNLKDNFPNPYTYEMGITFIENTKKDKPTEVFAICNKNEFIGAIGIHKQKGIYCKNAEIGYWLAEPFWGNGICTIAVAAIKQYGFSQLNIERIFAKVFSENEASKRVLEKNGFILEGKFKKSIFKYDNYMDELVYADYKI